MTSSREAVSTAGGRSAVTITDATLRFRSAAPCTSRPRCVSIAWTDCSVKGALRKRVARSLQTDDEAVADELIVARAAQRRDVFDPGRNGRRGGETKRERQNQSPHHPPLTWTEPSGWTAPETVTPLSSLRTLTMSPIEPSCSAEPVVMIDETTLGKDRA